MNTVSVDREFLEHCLSVMRGVGELCQPIPRKSEDDPTEYCGGQALAELANCYNKLQETIAYAEQVALPQAEQPAKQITCHAEGERCYGCAHYRGEADVCEFAEQPEAGRDLAAHIAEAIEKERFEIVTADLYRKALEEVIRDALKVFRPQAQEAVRAAGLYPLYNELIDLIGECAVTDEMSCGVCRAEEGDDHHDSCPIGIIEEWAHNNLARESPPTNAEAVRLLRELRDAARAYWDGGMVGAAEKRDRFRLALRAADAYIAAAQKEPGDE